MIEKYAVRLAVVLVCFGVLAGGVSVAPTVGYLSDESGFGDNHIGAAEEWETEPPGDPDPPGDPGPPADPGPSDDSEPDGADDEEQRQDGIQLEESDGGELTVFENESDVELTAVVPNETATEGNETATFEVGNLTADADPEPEGNETVAAFTFDAGALEKGTHDYTLTIGDERLEGTVTVLPEGDPEYDLSVDAPASVGQGENATLELTLQNNGAVEGELELEVLVGNDTVEERTVGLEPDEQWSERFSIDTETEDDLEWEVLAGEKTETGAVSIDHEPGERS